MDFELSDEQRLLQETVARFMADRYDFEARRKYMAQPLGYDPAIWAQYAELGLLALPFAEEDGGMGGDAVEMLIVMEEMGKALALEPFVSTVVLCGAALRHGATPEQRASLVESIVGGELVMAFAHAEAAARYDIAHVETQAKKNGDAWSLEGDKTLVLHGGAADKLIVSARVSGAAGDEGGVGLFVVDARGAGVQIRDYPTQDGMRAAEVSLSGAAGELLGGSTDAMPVIRRVIDEGTAALCSEAVGAMDKSLWLTIEYIKTREQFGRPIGSFQVLQHRGSEMFVELELSRSISMYAAISSRSDDAAERARALSAAKVQINLSSRAIGQAAIQMHGGVGMTMEYQIGHYFKRLSIIEKMYGDMDYHRGRLGETGGPLQA